MGILESVTSFPLLIVWMLCEERNTNIIIT